MSAYLWALLEVVRPRTLLFVAVDGVAPIAKMNQQRTRRFLSAHVAEVTERVGGSLVLHIPMNGLRLSSLCFGGTRSASVGLSHRMRTEFLRAGH